MAIKQKIKVIETNIVLLVSFEFIKSQWFPKFLTINHSMTIYIFRVIIMHVIIMFSLTTTTNETKSDQNVFIVTLVTPLLNLFHPQSHFISIL